MDTNVGLCVNEVRSCGLKYAVTTVSFSVPQALYASINWVYGVGYSAQRVSSISAL